MSLYTFYKNIINKNILNKLIGINIIIYLIKLLLPETWSYLFIMPSKFSIFILMPWTFVTSLFMHFNFSHILWNMLYLFYFGNTLLKEISNRKFAILFFTAGGLANLAILIYCSIYNIDTMSLGASGAIAGIISSSIFINPNKKISLFILDIKLKYFAWYFIIFNILNIYSGYNIGGCIAHLIGFLTGYIWIKRYYNRNIFYDMFKFNS
jgi:membrane associated rhomboid family serine protease